MKIIADSSASRTEWALVDGATVVEHAFTKGLNPFFHTRRDISHSIRLELPEAFFKRRWERIHFYGAGCTSLEKKKIVEASLVAQFKTPVTVESDLLGAARGLLINEAGIACILGSGSNSCYYDGRAIVKNVRSLGYILGDEGSAAYIGKRFLSDCLKDIAPAQLVNDFFEYINLSPDEIMSAIYMLGLSFVYAFTGSLYFSDIAASVMLVDGQFLLYVAMAFVIAGIGFKISLVPFHLWTADVYQGAPTSVTSYLSVVSKGAAAFAAFVVLTQVFGAVYSQVWEWMLYALIILTITLGNLFAIRQTNMKRFLAFSSISQAGYIMLGVIACNATGVASLSYYVLVYVVSNLAAFGVIQAIENATGKVDMTDYNGLYKTNPKLSFAMMLAMFSLGGIPPFAGFFSKFFIFSSALEGGSVAVYVLVFIALLNTIISLYYYLLVVKAMFINPNDNPIATFKSHWSERAGLVVCVAGIILIGLASCIYTALNHAAAAGF